MANGTDGAVIAESVCRLTKKEGLKLLEGLKAGGIGIRLGFWYVKENIIGSLVMVCSKGISIILHMII